jgi:hypothetical protein
MAARSDHVTWTKDRLDKALDMRVNHDFAWDTIARVLGIESADAVRIKTRRVIVAGEHPVPEKGTLFYTTTEVVRGAPTDLAGDTAEQYIVDEPVDTRPADDPQAKDEDLPYELHGTMVSAKYTFDGETYYFPVNNVIVSIAKARWADILADYSQHGANLTQQEIALKQGMNLGVLRAMLQLYGAFKASPPVPREELADATPADLPPLFDRAIEVKQARFLRDLDRYKLTKLEDEVHKLREQVAVAEGTREAARTLLREVVETFPRARAVERLDFGQMREARDRHAPVFDPHFGATIRAESGGWGNDYNTDVAAEAFLKYCDQLALDVAASPHPCHVLHLTLGGDLFNAFERRTRAGTPLERDRDDRVVFRVTLDAVTRGIERLQEVADYIVIRSIPGNHDGLFADLFEEALALYYRGHDRVQVPNELGKRKAFLVGDTLHVLDHGEGFERIGPKQLLDAETVARQVGGPLFHRASRIYLYVGHTHHLESVRVLTEGKQRGHLQVIRCPSFSETTEYEEKLVFAGEGEGIFFTLNPRGRIVHTANVILAEVA